MKRNDTCFLFKSLALFCLLLGNLTYDVMCAGSAPDAIKIETGDVTVAKNEICNRINKYYKLQNTDYFSTLVNATSKAYDFYSLDVKAAKEILKEEIETLEALAVPATASTTTPVTAQNVFNDFKAESEKFKNEITGVQASNVTLKALKDFLNGFEFKNDHFVSGTGATVDFSNISDKLVVNSDKDLNGITDELKKFTFATTKLNDYAKAKAEADLVKIDDLSEKAKNTKKASDEAEEDRQKAAADATAKAAAVATATDAKAAADAAKVAAEGILAIKTTEAEEKKKAADDAAKDLTAANEIIEKEKTAKTALDAALRSEFITKLNGYFSNAKATNQISLGKLLEALKDYHIEIKYTAPVSGSTSATVTTAVSDSKPASTDPNYNFSISPVFNDISPDNIFLPSFINTAALRAKEVFVAISKEITEPDVDKHFKAILTELDASNVSKTLPKALESFKKTVTNTEFNNVFNEIFPTELNLQPDEITAIKDVVTIDGNNCKFNIAYLSTEPQGDRFNTYIKYLEEKGLLNETSKSEVANKGEAVSKFFNLLKDKLGDYEEFLKTKIVSTGKGTDDDKGKGTGDDKGKGTDDDKGNDDKGKSSDQQNATPGVTPKKDMNPVLKWFLIIGGGFVAVGIIGAGGTVFYLWFQKKQEKM